MRIPLRKRYKRATRQTAPNLAARHSGLVARGYWVDASSYFFVAEASRSAGGTAKVPYLADCRSRRVEPLLEVARLRALLWPHIGHELDETELAEARFDLPERETLA